jgi:hypothetical protein
MELLSVLATLPKGIIRIVHDREVYRIKSRSLLSSLFASTSEEDDLLRFVNLLREQLPCVLLWLDVVLNQELRVRLGNPDASSDGAGFWVVPQSVSTNSLLPQLFEGGWGMFFFQSKTGANAKSTGPFAAIKAADSERTI